MATKQEILERLDLPSLIQELIPSCRRAGRELSGLCPFHDDKSPSLSVNPITGVFKCQTAACGAKGSFFDLFGKVNGLAFPASIKMLAAQAGLTLGKGTISTGKPKEVDRHDYQDTNGNLLYQRVRFEPGDNGRSKKYLPFDPATGKWKRPCDPVLYHLPDVVNASTVFIVEGERKGDVVKSWGLVGTCFDSGANSTITPAMIEALTGKDLIILPDNDDSGRVYRDNIIKAMLGKAASIKVVDLPGLAIKGDIVDWIKTPRNDKARLLDLIRQAPEWEPEQTPRETGQGENEIPEWEQPLPFGEIETPALSVDPFPVWLREYCQAVIDSTQTPPGMAVMMALSVLAACLQKRFVVAPFGDDYREPLALWTVTALDPGNRKTAVTGALTFPLTSWENEQQKKCLPQIREVETKRAALEKRIGDLITKAAKLDNQNERDAMLADVNRLKEEMPDELKPPLIWTDDTTPERLQGLLVENQERMALLSDEGGIFEIMAGLYSNGRANLNIFLKGHAGSECRAERQGRSARLESPCLTFGLAVQPDVISDLSHGDKKRFRGNGTLARFLYCLPKSTIGNRDVTRRDGIPESLRARYQAEIDSLLNIAPITNENGIEQPRILTLDHDARQSWIAFYQFIESNMGTRGALTTIQDWASKLPGAAARIAGLLHVATYGTAPQEISNDTMTAALDLAELLIKHARAAFSLMGDDEAVKDAKDVLRWIIEERRESFRQRECQRALQRLNLERLERAVKILSERHIISEPEKQAGGKGKGKPSISYTVNPAIFEMEP